MKSSKITCEICHTKTCRSGSEKRIFMAKFPLDKDRCKKWVAATGNQDLVYVPIEKLHQLKYVCGKHFKPKDFKEKGTQLRRTAVPSLDISLNPITEEMMKDFPLHVARDETNASLRDHIYCDQGMQEPSTSCQEKSSATKFINIDNNIPSVAMHRFPNRVKYPERFEAWVTLVGGTLQSESDYDQFKYKRICDLHFTEKDKNRNNRLNALAIPTLHLPETSSVNGEDSTVEFVEDFDDDVSMSDKCDDHDVDVRPDAEHLHIEQPVPTANEKNTSYWKHQLSYILHNTQFCGICLCTEDNMNMVNDTLEIFVGGRSHSKTVLEILGVVFKEDDEILSNSQICNGCTKNMIQSYMFIQRAKETSRMLNCHLNDLYNKSCYIRNNILNNEKQPKNVLLTLENYDDTHHLYNPVHIAPAKKSEVVSNKETEETEMQKPKYKCSICNLFLPSFNTWRLHERNAHRDKKHKVDPNRLRQVRKMCKLCRRVIQIGGLAEHMTKYHKHSMTRSPRNIAVVSGGDLNTHTIEKPSNKDGKCLTCLKKYKEEGLEQQPCRFCCAKCAEASCLHYKYLSWYREQISMGLLRAKCLHCEYVCKSEEALLKHVNMRHVKHLSKIAFKS